MWPQSVTCIFFGLWLVQHSGSSLGSVLSEHNAEFSFRLYQMLTHIENDSNLIVSPASITLSLGLLQLGARGNTLSQLQGIMGYGLSDPHVLEAVTQSPGDPGNSRLEAQVQFSNTLWVHGGVRLLPAFIQSAVEWYNSSLLSVNFSHSNNSELHQGVQGRGGDEVNSGDAEIPDGTVAPHMALLSSVLFQGVWQKQFMLSNTQDLPFTLSDGSSVKVPMMYQLAEVNFGQFSLPSELRYTVLELLYLDHLLSLLVVMPSDRKTPLYHLESQLTGDAVRLWDTGLRHTKMDIFLPSITILEMSHCYLMVRFRFKMHSRVDLKPVLQSLGFLDAFEPSSADFTGISDTESLYVSDALHEAGMEVTEGGTKAAAATVMVLLKRSRAPVFKADRPFLFILRQIKRGTVLFMGRVLNPTQQVQ